MGQEHLSLNQVVCGVCVVQYSVFCVLFCRLVCPFLFAILLSVFRFMVSDFPFVSLNFSYEILFWEEILKGTYSLWAQFWLLCLLDTHL